MIIRSILLAMVCCLAAVHVSAADTISLAGQWRFVLDPQNAGIKEAWFGKNLSERVTLPGSTDTNRKGTRNNRPADFAHLARLYEYTGPAWYQRDITIPSEWKAKRVVLFLERCHWETRVWLDGEPLGMRDSLVAPHVYDFGVGLPTGVHKLTIRVDNTIKYNVGNWAHSITEETQTNWNGIVGRIELRATPSVWVDDVQVYPNVVEKSVRVSARLCSRTGKPRTVLMKVLDPSTGKVVADTSLRDDGTGEEWKVQSEMSVGKDVRLWDEFSPSMYDLVVAVISNGETDERRVSFGMRDLRVKDKRITMNGRKLFLRGTLECCIFPKTGYPPADVDSWLRILKIAKGYGLNHMRFHSWCPPDAAFQAADRMGFLFQVELPQWVGNVGKDTRRDQFIQEEELRVLDEYGNHPSFGMLCMGNELLGDPQFLQSLVILGKQSDPRHLYTPSTWRMFGEHDDYRVAAVRGLHGPTTDVDFSAQDAEHPVPVISHEIGQWTVFPDVADIPKYTGVTRPRNIELVRDMLNEHGLLDQAPMFVQASGKLAAELYKEEIEVLLRTPGHGGFQLLDLHDFPGQGTSLVGILDPFWDSKGLIAPAEWRRFCGPIVPLLRMSKRTWTTGETFEAKAQVAQFGPKDITGVPMWAVRDTAGHTIASGALPAKRLSTGDLHDLGSISVPLSKVSAPSKLIVTVSLKGTEASNSWDIWVYPAKVDVTPPADVVVTQSKDEAVSSLKSGRKVLLLATRSSLVDPGRGSFTSVFWNPVMFPNEAGKSQGVLCDPNHPALAEFPTEFYTNWQWYDLLEKSASMNLDGTAKSFRPIVQIIDNFVRDRKMGNLLEARVGDGRLVVCSMTLQDDKPACRQMLRSILDYMGSPRFDPKQELTKTELDAFLTSKPQAVLQSLGATVVMVDSQDTANPVANAIDDDPDTIWHTQWQDAEPPYPHEIQIDLRKSVDLAGLKYLPRQDNSNGWFTDYEFYVSDDGKDWGAPVAKGTFAADDSQKVVKFDQPHRGRFIRLVALKGFQNMPWASIAEFDVIAAPAQPQ